MGLKRLREWKGKDCGYRDRGIERVCLILTLPPVAAVLNVAWISPGVIRPSDCAAQVGYPMRPDRYLQKWMRFSRVFSPGQSPENPGIYNSFRDAGNGVVDSRA